jgi:acyl-CoA thioester hydrolase
VTRAGDDAVGVPPAAKRRGGRTDEVGAPPACGGERRRATTGFVAAVPVRWSDIDMYQHVNHATMVTILEEARVPFLSHAFGADITSIGLLIADVRVTYKGQLRLTDSPLQVTMWVKRLRAVDFTLGYEVRSVNADPESKPAVIAESQLAAFHIDEQRLVRLLPHHREYLQRWLR